MKKFMVTIGVTGVLLTVLAIVGLVWFVKGPRGGTVTTVQSPGGMMVARAEGVSGLVVVTIRDNVGRLLHRWDTGASSYQWWTIEWRDKQKLLLDSGDIGAITLEHLSDGTWREADLGQVFSPDGTLVASTSWESGSTRKLSLWFGRVTGRRSYNLLEWFTPDLVVEDPFNCARWDGNRRVIVKTVDGEHVWAMREDQSWVQEK